MATALINAAGEVLAINVTKQNLAPNNTIYVDETGSTGVASVGQHWDGAKFVAKNPGTQP